MSYQELKSLAYYERKEYQELKYAQSAEARDKRERATLLGFFVISLLATLLLSGAMRF
jgi:hypothetical protein